MAENDDSPKTLHIAEQIEGEHVETSDYFFCKVGDSLPLSSSSAAFDPADIPSKPLLLTQQFGLLFAAHSSGFCVSKTKDVYAAAKDSKDTGSGSSVQELSVVDVDHIGRVSILSLSDDSSLLSAVVGSEIHIFSVNSLVNDKDKKPICSCSVESNHVRDMLWIKDTKPTYIVLTDDNKLHAGVLFKPLAFIMDDVDAVERSVNGEFLAIGRKNTLTILSSKFKKIQQLFLPPDSFSGDSNANDTVKVDSIRWVRPDCIVVGCVQQIEDVREESYFLQVIKSGDNKIIYDSSKLAAVQFSDLFPGLVDDIVPSGCGPHLFMYYLENCELAFVSNRKNTDQHIMLLSWSQLENQVTVVDIERDTRLPRIGLQENGDDNLVIGLCVDETSVYENVEVKVGLDEQREFRPHCLLVCLTVEGKLVMFNVASIAGPQRQNQALSALSPNLQNIPAISCRSPVETLQSEEERSKLSGLDTTKIRCPVDQVPVAKNTTTGSNRIMGFNFVNSGRKDPITGDDGQEAIQGLETSSPFGHSQQKISNQLLKDPQAQFYSTISGNNSGIVKPNAKCISALPEKSQERKLVDFDKSPAENSGAGVSHSISTNMSSSNHQGTSDVSNARSPFGSPSFARSTLIGNSSVSNNAGIDAGSFSSSLSIGTGMNLTRSVPEMPRMSPGVKSQSREVVISHNSMTNNAQLVKGNLQKSSGQLNTKQNFSKQFGNVHNMSKELDNLLECIEEAGGFRDSCTTAQSSSLEALEEGMRSLSERSSVCKFVTEERLREMELLLDKTVQVLARKTHMEGIVRQTTDGQYWDLWNRQKLNSELDQKRLNILNLSQDLVNRMIELERHFNALELNLFGESNGTSLVSRNFHCRSATSRFGQSLHAIHNATVSQLAAAQQLSDFLSSQMSVLSIKSPPVKQGNIKRQVFESIGIPYSEDNVVSPNMVNLFDTPPNKYPVGSSSAATNKELKRNQLSGQRTDFETARRRRDSIDRNWAKFEAPKTTVKRKSVHHERKNSSGFSSVDKQSVSPFKLEGSVAAHPKALGVQNRIAGNDAQEKINSGSISTPAFKWACAFPEKTQVEAGQSLRLPLVQGNMSTAVQNVSISSSTTPPFSLPFSMAPDRKDSNPVTTGKPRTLENTSIFDAGSADLKSPGSQWVPGKSTVQGTQPSPTPLRGSQMPITASKDTESSKADGRSSPTIFNSKHDVKFPSTSGSFGFSSGPASSFSAMSTQSQNSALVEGGSTITEKVVKDSSMGVFKVQPVFSFSSSPTSAASFSPIILNSVSMQSAANKESQKAGPELLVGKVGTDTNLANTLQPPQGPSSAGDRLKSHGLTQSSTIVEVPKVSESPTTSVRPPSISVTPASDAVSNAPSEKKSNTLNMASIPPFGPGGKSEKNDTATPATDMVSNAPLEKQSDTLTIARTPFSDFGGAAGDKNNSDASIVQGDEMEEEALETNQATDLCFGSLAGFGLGSAVTATAPKLNPFGASISNTPESMQSSVSLSVPTGQLFRPASFSFQSPQASQQSQSPIVGATAGAFGSSTNPQQPSAATGFGQPGQVGFGGQQALGSVLGSFGQSRQIGTGMPGSGFGGTGGGFSGISSVGGGFANVSATSGGFAGIGATASGFAGAAAPSGFAASAPSGGGFGALASGGGGFAAAAAPSGGFGAIASSGGGFGGGFAAAGGVGGGFGAFSNQGASGFSSIGADAAGGRQPPSQLFTQIRR